MESKNIQCAKCAVKNRACRTPQGEGPDFCPTLHRKPLIEKSLKEYAQPGIGKFAHEAAIQEADGYGDRQRKPYLLHPIKTRVQETCEFALRMGYQKLGVAFCAGLHKEAAALTRILEAQGFDVVSVVCKAGCTPKETIGIGDEDKVYIGAFESMCSPIAQAMLMNEEKTDFNVLVGLCVGHDSLFLKYAQAFSTVLVAKDRVLAHNPVGALYSSGIYYERMRRKGF
jgi:uncharacterized metal-binding protein